jgi:hypothetical protein
VRAEAHQHNQQAGGSGYNTETNMERMEHTRPSYREPIR